MIESLSNEKIKNYTKLQQKKYREETGLFIASGAHLVEEALKLNLAIDILLLNGEENIYGDKVTYVTESILKKVSNLDSAPKVLAVVKKKEGKKIKGNVILLDDISDPGNLGTIIRSAVAFNYQTVIISPKTVDPYNVKTVRATEGMLFKVNLIIGDLTTYLKQLKEMNYLIYGTNVNDGTLPLKEEHNHALIIGSEAHGMNPNLNSFCDKNLYIKMNDECESLNASISASILMYILGGK